MDMLKWIQDWYLENCDGDWEHCYGITISTLDNPGWVIDIDLVNTNLENRKFENVDIERSESDWIYCSIADKVFHGNGGSKNLEEILIVFRNWAENNIEGGVAKLLK